MKNLQNLRIALIFVMVFPLLVISDVLKIFCFRLSEFFARVSSVLYTVLG
jgi:hypothetical protein